MNLCVLSAVHAEEALARATVDAMQALAPPLPKVDSKTLYDNNLLKALDTEVFSDKAKSR
jgi:hypothetical protein